MYNKFLEKYLDYNPEKVLSKKGVVMRKVISPLLRFVVPFVTPNSRLKVVRQAKLPKKPVIFAATHGFREDVDKYWIDFVDKLMAEVEFYDYELELNTKYRPKGITIPKNAFAFMDNIVPNKNNIFLFERHF